jgi:hypothetical protein
MARFTRFLTSASTLAHASRSGFLSPIKIVRGVSYWRLYHALSTTHLKEAIHTAVNTPEQQVNTAAYHVLNSFWKSFQEPGKSLKP